MYRSSICINLKDFDISKFVVSEMKNIRTKDNINMKISDFGYLNNDNEVCKLYITLPEVETWGPYPQYRFGSIKKSEEDIVGYTIPYSNEKVIKLFREIELKCSRKFRNSNMKPVFNDKRMAYFKLNMFDNNIATKFYLDKKGSELISPLSLKGHFGLFTPLIHIKSLYFGDFEHNAYNTSIQLSIVKGIFQKREIVEPDFKFDSEQEE